MGNFLHKLRRRFSSAPTDFIEVERAEWIFYLNYLRGGMTVFDVGANVGELTLLFSRFASEVHAFEASSVTFNKLKTICEAAQRTNVTLNNMALSDVNSTIDLHVYKDSLSTFNSMAARPLKKYGLDAESIGIEKVLAVTIDYYCETNKITRIDLLKIDVEGAELQVMRGARQMLKAKKVRRLTFEFGQTTFDMGNSVKEIEDLLREMDYKISNIIKHEPLFPGRESVETAKFAMHIAKP